MRAAVWHGAGDVRVEAIADPEAPEPGRVTVEVNLAAICASDVAEYRDGPHVIPVVGPHPLTGASAPMVLGHEYVGRVVATGAGVTDLPAGTRVCGDACIRCGRCYWCLRGEYNICERGGSVGFHADGAFADYVDVPAYTLYPVPDEITDRSATAVEPLAVGLHALRQAGFSTGDHVVVIGYGMIGAGVAAIAQATGAGRVMVVEPNAHRRSVAEAMGVTEIVGGTTRELRSQVRQRTDGIGADVVVDCTGVAEVPATAIELSRRGGRVVLCGISHGTAAFAPARLVYFERAVIGALGYRFDHPAVIDLLAQGRLDLAPVFGEPIPLGDIVAGGFDRTLTDPAHPLRVPVAPQR